MSNVLMVYKVLARTSVKATADGGNDNLKSEESTHAEEDGPALLVNGVNTNDMNDCQSSVRKNLGK